MRSLTVQARRLGLIGVFSYALLQLYIYLPRDLQLSDEGYQFFLAWAVGEKHRILYRDVFTMYAPGYVWTRAAFLEIFGYQVVHQRIYHAIWMVILLVGVFILVDRFSTHRWAPLYSLIFLVSLLPVGLKPSQVVFTLPFIYLGGVALESKLTQNHILKLGIFAAAAGLMSQEIGGFLCLSFLILLLLVRGDEIQTGDYSHIIRDFGTFVLGGVVIVLPVILYFIWHEALPYLIHDLFLALPAFSDAMSISISQPLFQPFNSFQPTLRSLPIFAHDLSVAIGFLLPALLIGVTSIITLRSEPSWKHLSIGDRFLIWIATLTALFYIIALGRSDASHLGNSILPAAILLSLLLDRCGCLSKLPPVGQIGVRFLTQLEFKKAVTIVLVIAPLIVGVGVGQAQIAVQVTSGMSTLNTTSDLQTANGLSLSSEKYETISKTAQVVNRTTVSSRIVALPYLPGYYHITNTTPPTRYASFLPGEMDDNDVSRFIHVMNSTTTVVVYYPDRSIFTHRGDLRLRDYYPRIHKYIISECLHIKDINNKSSIYIC